MKEKYSFKRIFITAVTAILLGLLYFMIFGFSAQDAEESGQLSKFVSGKCAEFLNSITGGRWDNAALTGIAEMMESPLRKLAHFGEYACMGMLVYILLSQWVKQGRKRYFSAAGWLFLSAAGDEIHQYFVPGRYASVWDVLLDTCGGICGMLFCILLACLFMHGRHHRKRQSKKSVGRI